MTAYARATGLATLAFAREVTLGLLEDAPEDGYLHQPLEGGNHALWIIGHITQTDEMFLSGLKPRGPKLPDSWPGLFGQGSKPTNVAATYPRVAEIKEKMAELRDELIAWFKSMDEAQLRAPLPDDWARFAGSYCGLINTMAWHEGLHAGQLTVVRKSLGLAPRFA